MEIRVITLRYSEGLQGYPQEALRKATLGREVLGASEHFYLYADVPHLTLVLKLGGVATNSTDWRLKAAERPDLEQGLSEEDKKLFRELKQLIATIIDTYATQQGVGLPIGNLTSQWFANDYLNELDYLAVAGFEPCRSVENAELTRMYDVDSAWMRPQLYISTLSTWQKDTDWLHPLYGRYVFFCDSKAAAWRIYDEVRQWLVTERHLTLKDEATHVMPVAEGIPFLGLRIYPRMLRLQHTRLWRTRRHQHVREREFIEERISAQQLVASVRSMDGCVRWFGMRNVLRTNLNHEILATEERAASGSNRQNRGGSWNNDAGNATSSYRNNNNPSNTNNNLGFRLFSTLIKASLSNSVQPVPDTVRTNNAGSLSSSRRESANRRQLLFSFMGDEG